MTLQPDRLHRQMGLMVLAVVLVLPLQASVTAPVVERWVATYNGTGAACRTFTSRS